MWRESAAVAGMWREAGVGEVPKASGDRGEERRGGEVRKVSRL